jgi:hypothetical protein
VAAAKVSYTELVHTVVRETQEPLTVDDIMARVDEIMPISTRNPKSTIRNAVTQSRLIVNTGGGRYGWKLRVINGSLLRHSLTPFELSERRLIWDFDVHDALWPENFAAQKYRTDRDPLVVLPNGTAIELTQQMYAPGVWGSEATAAFWTWLEQEDARAGDSLLFQVVDGVARRYAVSYEPWGDRDEKMIRQRNEALAEITLQMEYRPYGAAPWEITSHLLAIGFYKDPVPPDAISEVWENEVYDIDDEEWEDIDGPGADELFELIQPLFNDIFADAYDFETPDLPSEYEPGEGRRPRPSEKARAGEARIYTFRVMHRAYPHVWRDIELADDQTLEDLHLSIQDAYGWDDDHLYSFFLSGHAWDRESEVGSPWSDSVLHTHQVQIGDLKLEEGRRFLYLFDYGDGHEFDVILQSIRAAGASGRYPRIVNKKGKAPPQYPDYGYDDEADWD